MTAGQTTLACFLGTGVALGIWATDWKAAWRRVRFVNAIGVPTLALVVLAVVTLRPTLDGFAVTYGPGVAWGRVGFCAACIAAYDLGVLAAVCLRLAVASARPVGATETRSSGASSSAASRRITDFLGFGDLSPKRDAGRGKLGP